MEAQPAFIAQPALVDVDVSTADRSVDFAIACGLTGNAAAQRSSRVIDTQVASRAAATANAGGTLQKPRPHLESEIRTRERSNRADVTTLPE